ncbi:unnamed protein product, partial [Mesorhabditis belari]|uniref:Uncharacterized protein n=1 Tax=Mesorhabditis belari TaxID=2138241 RepID=A0AAF3FSS5_9BILA
MKPSAKELVSSIHKAFTANPPPKDQGVGHLKVTVDVGVTECRVAASSANVNNKRAFELSNNEPEHFGRRLEALGT